MKLIFFFHIWYEKNSQFNTSALKILKVPTYVEAAKKNWATFPMLNFSRRTPTWGVCSKWDSRNVLKIAHFGVFRHIGGSGGAETLLTSKYSGSRSSMPKMATFRPPGAEKLIFSDKTLSCSIDCAPKHKHYTFLLSMKSVKL